MRHTNLKQLFVGISFAHVRLSPLDRISPLTDTEQPLSVSFLRYQPGTRMALPIIFLNQDDNIEIRRGAHIHVINRLLSRLPRLTLPPFPVPASSKWCALVRTISLRRSSQMSPMSKLEKQFDSLIAISPQGSSRCSVAAQISSWRKYKKIKCLPTLIISCSHLNRLLMRCCLLLCLGYSAEQEDMNQQRDPSRW
jgi:hypothetical protein